MSPNGPEQPHLAPLLHPSHLPMGPGASFKLSLGLQFFWSSVGGALVSSSTTVMPGSGSCWSRLVSHLGFTLPCHWGSVWQSQHLTLACRPTDLRPASSTQACMIVWTLGWPCWVSLGLPCLPCWVLWDRALVDEAPSLLRVFCPLTLSPLSLREQLDLAAHWQVEVKIQSEKRSCW